MNKSYEAFFILTEDILRHPLFESQIRYIHHKEVSIYEHVITVAYQAYCVAKKLKRDARSTARGALLHDFFLYDWHIEGKTHKKKLFKKHGFTHANYALTNAIEQFDLNKKERDIIAKHMFPLNLIPPRYIESWIVNMTDTVITFKEVFRCKRKMALMAYIEHRKKV